jgi:hypothetical protein
VAIREKGGLGVTQHLADGPRFSCSISIETDTPSAILPANAQASAAFANFIQLGIDRCQNDPDDRARRKNAVTNTDFDDGLSYGERFKSMTRPAVTFIANTSMPLGWCP